MACTQSELLNTLPTELQLDIISHLDYGGALNLSGVNQHFRQLIDPEEWPAESKRAFVARAQHFPQHNVHRRVQHRQACYETLYSVRAGFACFTCFRVRPMHCFGGHNVLGYPKDKSCNEQRQRQSGEGDGAAGSTKASTRETGRRCLDCSIAANELRHGLEVVVPRVTSTLVDHSGGEPGGAARVLLVDMVEAEDRVFCDECNELHDQEVWLRTCASDLGPSDQKTGNMGTVKDGLVVHDAVDHGNCYWEMGRA